MFSESTLALNNLYRLVETDPHAALARMAELDALFTADIHYIAFRPGVLVNAGSALADTALIREGVDALSALLDSGDLCITPWRRTLLYNPGNGLSELAARERRNGVDPDFPLTQQTKQAYREAIRAEGGEDGSELMAQIYTNYGNALSVCGRHYEALLAYDSALRFEPAHSMALGNKGIELARYAFLARNQSALLLAEAYELCRAGANDDQLDVQGLASARTIFAKHRDALEPIYAQWRDRLEEARSRKPKRAERTRQEDTHHHFAVEHGLYLNLCVHSWHCAEQYTDALFFEYVTPLDDPHVFDRLARYFNQAKEDYATARYLLVEAQRQSALRQRISDRTRYADLLEYANYGLTAGLAKSAYAAAYNLLDKIAVFLKWELSLPDRETDTTFKRIWYADRKASSLRPEIRAKADPNLFALYDMSLDLQHPDFKRFGDLRRAITHRHLVVHDWLAIVGEYSEPDEHVLFNDLVAEGIALLQLSKAALVYLAAYLSQEHDRRVDQAQGLLGPLTIWWQDEMR